MRCLRLTIQMCSPINAGTRRPPCRTFVYNESDHTPRIMEESER
jgi:hypothetical protein